MRNCLRLAIGSLSLSVPLLIGCVTRPVTELDSLAATIEQGSHERTCGREDVAVRQEREPSLVCRSRIADTSVVVVRGGDGHVDVISKSWSVKDSSGAEAAFRELRRTLVGELGEAQVACYDPEFIQSAVWQLNGDKLVLALRPQGQLYWVRAVGLPDCNDLR